MRRRRLVLSATVVAAAAGACTLTTSLSDLADGRIDGADGAEPSPPAGNGDGGTSEASSTTSPGTATGFCDSRTPAPLFCADFDGGRPYDVGWGTTWLTAGGVLAGDEATGVLRAATPANSAGTGCYAFLSYPIPKSGGHIHVELRLRPTTAIASGQYGSFVLQQNTPSIYRAIRLYIGPGSATMQVEASNPQFQYERHDLASGLPVGQWQTYAVDVRFGSKTTLDVAVDSVSQLSLSDVPYGFQPQPYELQVGITNVQTPSAASIEYDDVVVDVE
jgi:hypothetical protein